MCLTTSVFVEVRIQKANIELVRYNKSWWNTQWRFKEDSKVHRRQPRINHGRGHDHLLWCTRDDNTGNEVWKGQSFGSRSRVKIWQHICASCMNIIWLKQQRRRTSVFRLLSIRHMFFIILKKRSSMSSGSACSSYTRNALSIHKYWRCGLCKYPTRMIL